MATNVSSVIVDVQNELVDTSAAFISMSEALRLYNRACKDFARETRCLKSWTALSTVAGTNQVALPANCMSVTKVILKILDTNGNESWRELDPVSMTKMVDFWPTFLSGNASFQTVPSAYTVQDRTILLNCPVVTDGSDDLYVFFDARASDITDVSQLTEIPEELLEGIVQFMVWKAMKKEREFNDAADAKRSYEAYCGKGRGWVKRQLLAGQWKIHLPLKSGEIYTFNPF
jgi:hypothetical protein